MFRRSIDVKGKRVSIKNQKKIFEVLQPEAETKKYLLHRSEETYRRRQIFSVQRGLDVGTLGEVRLDVRGSRKVDLDVSGLS